MASAIAKRETRFLSGRNIMVRHRGMLGGGILLGLLVLATDGRADEAAAMRAVEKMGGKVEVDANRPGKPVVAVFLKDTGIETSLCGSMVSYRSPRFFYEVSRRVASDQGAAHVKRGGTCGSRRPWSV
jgi:hypothetical protein